jgi:catechol 2,3-dioxygenase-like lactoylglutathione lyase family enzyme
MPKYEINHTHLTSADPKAAVAFYTQKLGGKITAERMLAGNQPAWDIDLGGLLIRISAGTGADDALKTKQSPRVAMRAQYGLHHLALTVDNLDEAAKDLKAKAVEFLFDHKPGSPVAFIIGPDGVLFELIGARPK